MKNLEIINSFGVGVNRFFLIFSIAILIITSIFALSVKLGNPQKFDNNVIIPQNVSSTESSPGIEVFLPKPNETISSPLKITGIVKGNGWNGFEGQVGTVKLQDSTGKELALTYLPATTEWTQLPTNFETILIFDAGNEVSGRLIFRNENASGDLERDKTFVLPVKFK